MRNTAASDMKNMVDAVFGRDTGDSEVALTAGARKSHAVDIVVGTPMKLLEMVRGRGWDRVPVPSPDSSSAPPDLVEEEAAPGEKQGKKPKLRRGRDKIPIPVPPGKEEQWTTGIGTPELGLGNVEWVVVDEADILFG
jgi:ATP-dependent RNA helicase MRH4